MERTEKQGTEPALPSSVTSNNAASQDEQQSEDQKSSITISEMPENEHQAGNANSSIDPSLSTHALSQELLTKSQPHAEQSAQRLLHSQVSLPLASDVQCVKGRNNSSTDSEQSEPQIINTSTTADAELKGAILESDAKVDETSCCSSECPDAIQSPYYPSNQHENNQTTQEIPSPVSPSISGQDSGVSTDDSGSDATNKASSPSEPVIKDDGQTACGREPSESVCDFTKGQQPQVLSDSQTNGSSDTNTSTSGTPITVSDLDTPSTDRAATVSDSSATASAKEANEESVYYIKWIAYGTNKVPIVTQNENGPCPLLAIMNVLLLKGKVKLAPMLEMVTSEQLMTYLGDCILENMPQDLSETTQANYAQNMQDAIGVMHKLQTGVDVNVKFTGVGDFEYTSECIIFDLLEISLYHGWLVDPQDADTVRSINQCSYNQLVERIISLKHSEREQDVTYALIAEQFLLRTASQLTYHGLCELSSVVKEQELCVFFRNNHFSTLYKHNNELFLLVTDQGFLTESNVVWETLSNVDGDCHFVDATFRTYTKPAPSTDPITNSSVPVGSREQIDQDHQVALFLQEVAAPPTSWAGGYQPQEEHAALTQADHEYALWLQEEENRRAMVEEQRPSAAPAPGVQPPHQGHGQGRAQVQDASADAQRRPGERGDRREKDKNCSIL